MDEAAIRTEMRLYVIESFVATQMAVFCLEQAPADALGAFAEIQDQVLEGARRQTFPQVDPAMSDLLSAELEAAAARFGEKVSSQINVVVKAQKGSS